MTPMKVVSADEMRRLDERAQQQGGLSAFRLMTAAGQAIAEEITASFNPRNPAIVCGKGNNAGDGFVVARCLHELGATVTVVCLEPASAYKGAAKKAWDALPARLKVMDAQALGDVLADCDLVVDALLGTGISGPARDAYEQAILKINNSRKPVVAIDVPSGLRDLQADEEPGTTICADTTLTIGLPKKMLLTLPGAQWAGRLQVLPINFPADLLTSPEWKLNWATPAELATWIPQRAPDSNKGTYGHVGLTGSAASYAGATMLTARAALRSGCGLVTIYTLTRENNVYKTALPEATSVILGGPDLSFFDADCAQEFADVQKKHTVLAMGPGLGTAPETREFVRGVLGAWDGPLVLDADGLNILAADSLEPLRGRQDCLITPHPGEMARLAKCSVKDVQANREVIAREFAQEWGVTVLLKGAGTIVALPDGQAWLIPGVEPALAKGGTGDVLTGVIASLFAQGMPLWKAAVLGASAHLAAGQRAAIKFGKRGVLATDVADAVPLVLDAMELDHL